jgi:DDE family transposase
MLDRASKHDRAACALKLKCYPKTPARKVPRTTHEGARDMARQIAKSQKGRTSGRLRKKVETLFAHLRRILKLDRLRLRGPKGARDEFLLAATAQNLRKLAKLIPTPNIQPSPRARWRSVARNDRAAAQLDCCQTCSTESAQADFPRRPI